MSPDRDSVSEITDRWAVERPDLDVTPMAVFGRIAKLQRIQADASLAAYGHLDLSASDFDVLATLRRSGKPFRLTPSELTASMMITSGGVTQRVDRLDALGLVQRQPSENDRRSTTVALTAAGRRLIDKALPLHVDAERKLLAGLSESEQAALIRLLGKLLGPLERE